LLTAACNFPTIEVIGNGSSVMKYYSCRDARAINIYDYGNSLAYFSGITEGEECAMPVRIDFGRFPHDELSILPAKLFKQLQLRITATAVAGANLWDTAVDIGIEVEQYISADKPTEKVILKETIVREDAAGTTMIDFQLPHGLWLRGIVIIVDEMTGNWYNVLQVRVNNGAELPWNGQMVTLVAKNFCESNIAFADYTAGGAVVAGAEILECTEELEDAAYMHIDFDPTRTLKDVLHTETFNDLTLRLQTRTCSTATKILAREYIVLGGE